MKFVEATFGDRQHNYR